MGVGVYMYFELPRDAFPDISPVMVPVFSEAHGMAPEEIERLIAFPIESAMNGLPDVTLVKSTSAFGMAVVYVYFEDDVDIYFARRLVSDRLAAVMPELPDLDEPPTLGPISTGLGEVFMYYLKADSTADTGGKEKNTWLREINDWVVSYQLMSVPGVTDVLSMGGHVLQFEVKLDPYAMRKFGIRLDEVVGAIAANNRNAGGQFVVIGAEEYLVRGIGLLDGKERLADIQVKVSNGTPVRVSDVAAVEYGSAVRRGVVTLNGEEEVVAGIVVKLFGENTSRVIERLDAKFAEIAIVAPPRRLARAVLQPGHARRERGRHHENRPLAGRAARRARAHPASRESPRRAHRRARASAVRPRRGDLHGMERPLGQPHDARRHRRRDRHARRRVDRDRREHLPPSRGRREPRAEADRGHRRGRERGGAADPLLGDDHHHRLPPPLHAAGGRGEDVLSHGVHDRLRARGLHRGRARVRARARLALPPREDERLPPLHDLADARLPSPPRRGAQAPRLVVAGTLALFVAAAALLSRLGTEFIPTLEEGAIQINVAMAPSISLERAAETVMKLERRIHEFPEVDRTVAKIGRPETGSHPHPVNSAHIQIALKPRSEWKNYATKAEIVDALSRALSPYPGVQLSFSQPIQNMFDELLTGVRTQIAVKLFGDDLATLRAKADEIREAIADVPGLVDLAVEQNYGQPQVQVIADRYACARYGVDAAEILETIETGVGGSTVGQIYLGTRRFDITARFKEEYRADPEAIGALAVRTRDGNDVPLSLVADVAQVVGPIQVNREHNQRRWAVTANVRDRDLGGVVADIKARVRDRVKLPPGYFIEYGGQFENQQRAMRRLALIVPAALAAIFLLLRLSLGRLRPALLIFTNVPLALIGGVVGLYLFGEYLSVPASVGFIALFGIAVQNGLILVTYIDHLARAGIGTTDAVIDGALLRLRPVLLTALTTVLGLVPLLFAKGMGSEVQRPLAIVVVFGLISSTFLTLFFIPALYRWFVPERKGDA